MSDAIRASGPVPGFGSVSGVGVLFARPLVGSRWTAAQGPLAQKTPTPLTALPVPPEARAA